MWRVLLQEEAEEEEVLTRLTETTKKRVGGELPDKLCGVESGARWQIFSQHLQRIPKTPQKSSPDKKNG